MTISKDKSTKKKKAYWKAIEESARDAKALPDWKLKDAYGYGEDITVSDLKEK